MEKTIPSDVLQEFQLHEADDMWIGDVKQEALFETWKKVKRLCTHQESSLEVNTIEENFNSHQNSQNNAPVSDISEKASDFLNEYSSESLDHALLLEFSDLDIAEIVQVPDQSDDITNYNICIGENVQYYETVSTEEILKKDDNISVDNISQSTDISANSLPVPVEHEPNTSPILLVEESRKITLDNLSNEIIDIASRCHLNTNDLRDVNDVNNGLKKVIGATESNLSTQNNGIAEIIDLTVTSRKVISCNTNENSVIDPRSINASSTKTSNDSSTGNLNNFDSVFKKPDYKVKKRKQEKKSMPKVFVVDDLLKVYEEKENERILKEKKAELEKHEKIKKKVLKEKEENIIKSMKEKKSSLLKNKKEILLGIKNLKRALKTAENKELFQRDIENFDKKLKEVEKSILMLDMQALQEKLLIKEEQ